MIMRVLIPDEGSIQVLGEPVSERTQDRIGYLPEERGLYAKMKVRDVLRFLGALKGLSEARGGAARPSLAGAPGIGGLVRQEGPGPFQRNAAEGSVYRHGDS